MKKLCTLFLMLALLVSVSAPLSAAAPEEAVVISDLETAAAYAYLDLEDGLAGAGGHHSRSTEHDHLPLHMGCRWLQGSNCGRRHW